MIEFMPMGVLLVSILGLCLIPTLWGLVRSIRRGTRKKTAVLGIVAFGIVAFSAWALICAAPKGARTIAQLKLPDGQEFVLRHYRFGWKESPKVRFYTREPDGTWTSYTANSEGVDPYSASLVLDAARGEISAGVAGSYLISEKQFIYPWGPDGVIARHLPLGVEPDEDDIYRDTTIRMQ